MILLRAKDIDFEVTYINLQEKPDWFQAALQRIQWVVDEMERAVLRMDWPTAGTLLSQNHSILQDFGVSTPQLDALCETAMQAGALGAKLTGAGCGGAIIAVCEASELEPLKRELGKTATIL